MGAIEVAGWRRDLTEHDFYSRSSWRVITDLEARTVARGNFARYREAQATPATLALWSPIEGFEHPLSLGRCDARAVIFDKDCRRAVAYADGHLTALFAVSDGVVDQITNELPQKLRFASNA